MKSRDGVGFCVGSAVRRYAGMVFAFFGTMAAASNMCAAERWIALTTPHFEMYTTNNEKQATEALKVFEQVRYFFLEANPSKTAPDTPVRIIAFRNEKEYKPYRFNEGAFAYYLHSRKRDYIVMQDISPEHYQAAVHEYTHLIVEHLGLKPPVWLNEGLAELYSSLEPRGKQAMVGKPLPGRVMILQTQTWLPLSVLINVKPDSPYYNERNKMSIFYAESWALTHMLEFGKQYPAADFPKFLGQIAAGKSSEQCFASVYGKTLKQVQADLHAYMHQRTVYVGLLNIRLSKQSLEPNVAPLSDFQKDLALADLLASQERTAAEAEQRLTELSKQHPENAEIEESLGYLAWQKDDTTAARDYFGKAEKAGSQDPDMLFQYAELLRAAGASDDEVVISLQKALAVRPNFFEARFNLGMTEMHARKWGAALTYLSGIKSVKPDRAFSLLYAIAVCDYNLRGFQESQAFAQRARQYADTPEKKTQVTEFLAFLDRAQHPEVSALLPANSDAALSASSRVPEVPPKQELTRDEPSVHWAGDLRHVEGIVKYVECKGKVLWLRMEVGSKLMTFEIDNPEFVHVRNTKDGYFDVTCGPQKPFRLGVFYIANPKPGPVAGEVKELVF